MTPWMLVLAGASTLLLLAIRIIVWKIKVNPPPAE